MKKKSAVIALLCMGLLWITPSVWSYEEEPTAPAIANGCEFSALDLTQAASTQLREVSKKVLASVRGGLFPALLILAVFSAGLDLFMGKSGWWRRPLVRILFVYLLLQNFWAPDNFRDWIKDAADGIATTINASTKQSISSLFDSLYDIFKKMEEEMRPTFGGIIAQGFAAIRLLVSLPGISTIIFLITTLLVAALAYVYQAGQIMLLLILDILGPIAICFGCIESTSHIAWGWIKRYCEICLWKVFFSAYILAIASMYTKLATMGFNCKSNMAEAAALSSATGAGDTLVALGGWFGGILVAIVVAGLSIYLFWTIPTFAAAVTEGNAGAFAMTSTFLMQRGARSITNNARASLAALKHRFTGSGGGSGGGGGRPPTPEQQNSIDRRIAALRLNQAGSRADKQISALENRLKESEGDGRARKPEKNAEIHKGDNRAGGSGTKGGASGTPGVVRYSLNNEKGVSGKESSGPPEKSEGVRTPSRPQGASPNDYERSTVPGTGERSQQRGQVQKSDGTKGAGSGTSAQASTSTASPGKSGSSTFSKSNREELESIARKTDALWQEVSRKTFAGFKDQSRNGEDDKKGTEKGNQGSSPDRAQKDATNHKVDRSQTAKGGNDGATKTEQQSTGFLRASASGPQGARTQAFNRSHSPVPSPSPSGGVGATGTFEMPSGIEPIAADSSQGSFNGPVGVAFSGEGDRQVLAYSRQNERGQQEYVIEDRNSDGSFSNREITTHPAEAMRLWMKAGNAAAAHSPDGIVEKYNGVQILQVSEANGGPSAVLRKLDAQNRSHSTFLYEERDRDGFVVQHKILRNENGRPVTDEQTALGIFQKLVSNGNGSGASTSRTTQTEPRRSS